MSTPNNDNITAYRFGEKLRALRKKRDMTQKQLGDLLEVHLSHVGRLENGEKNPNLVMLLKLISIFDVSLDALVRDDRELDV